jgi:hypothetical protein
MPDITIVIKHEKKEIEFNIIYCGSPDSAGLAENYRHFLEKTILAEFSKPDANPECRIEDVPSIVENIINEFKDDPSAGFGIEYFHDNIPKVLFPDNIDSKWNWDIDLLNSSKIAALSVKSAIDVQCISEQNDEMWRIANGAAICFIVDTQISTEDSLKSLMLMEDTIEKQLLERYDERRIPIILQYYRNSASDGVSIDVLNRELNRKDYPYKVVYANDSKAIFDTLDITVSAAINELNTRNLSALQKYLAQNKQVVDSMHKESTIIMKHLSNEMEKQIASWNEIRKKHSGNAGLTNVAIALLKTIPPFSSIKEDLIEYIMSSDRDNFIVVNKKGKEHIDFWSVKKIRENLSNSTIDKASLERSCSFVIRDCGGEEGALYKFLLRCFEFIRSGKANKIQEQNKIDQLEKCFDQIKDKMQKSYQKYSSAKRILNGRIGLLFGEKNETTGREKTEYGEMFLEGSLQRKGLIFHVNHRDIYNLR